MYYKLNYEKTTLCHLSYLDAMVAFNDKKCLNGEGDGRVSLCVCVCAYAYVW